MTDAISRSAVLEKIYSYAEQVHCRGEIELANGILKAMCVIEDAPALDVAPVVHRCFASILTVNDVDEWHRRIILDEGEKSKNCAVYYQESDFDLAPVVHAYWTKQGNDIVCSGKDGCYEAMRWIEYIARDYFDGKLPEHCPHCGARMDGDAHG